MPLLLTCLAIAVLIFLIAYIRLDTFLAFMLVCIGLGLASGLDVLTLGKALKKGIGDTLGDLVLIVGFGAMLGKLVAESGAAQRITGALVTVFGTKHLPWGMALAGFVIGIPLFYNAGFIVVFPLIVAVSVSTRLPILTVGIPMLSALSVAHGYLPPHPSPAALATRLQADMGKVLLYGITIATPAIALAGPIFGSTLKQYHPKLDPDLLSVKKLPTDQLPSLVISLVTALFPVLLLALTTIFKSSLPNNATVQLLSEPYFGMFLSVLLAMYTLGINRGESMKAISRQLEEAFKGCAPILLVVAGASALKEIMQTAGISQYLGEQLQILPIHPLVLGWLMAGLIRICVGSATVAGLTAAGLVAPLLISRPDVSPELMVLSVGAGSLICSHFNDGGFWLFKEYFNLSIKETLKTWTIMETIVSLVGLAGVLVLNAFI
ncbi:MAG: gluconate:H+ symporter [Siphonobacter sp.]